MTRTQRDGAPYDAWHRQGMLKATPGLTIDYDYVLADIVEATGGMNLANIAFDNWNINALRQAMGRLGIDCRWRRSSRVTRAIRRRSGNSRWRRPRGG